MVSNRKEEIEKDLKKLIEEGEQLYHSLSEELLESDEEEEKDDLILPDFKTSYQMWYSESLNLIRTLLPEREHDFIILYEIEKRKSYDILDSYTIHDYLMGIEISKDGEIIGTRMAFNKFRQQLYILKSINRILNSKLNNIQHVLQAELFDNELEQAKELNNKGFYRAAGAIAGVVLEGHLKQICIDHKISVIKKNPGINDFNTLLKDNDVIDIPNWRYIQSLADIRHLCDHKKEKEPDKDKINDLIQGVDKICKQVF